MRWSATAEHDKANSFSTPATEEEVKGLTREERRSYTRIGESQLEGILQWAATCEAGGPVGTARGYDTADSRETFAVAPATTEKRLSQGELGYGKQSPTTANKSR